jgi:hypothetical protein
MEGVYMVINYSEYRNKLMKLNTKNPKIKKIIDDLYIWGLNDYFKSIGIE